jgi:hypothetical protein
MFTGHMHRWLIARQDGVMPWDGTTPISLPAPERYLVVVAAVCDGWCATYDTASGELTPIFLRGTPSAGTID